MKTKSKVPIAAGALIAALIGGLWMSQVKEQKQERENVPSMAEEPLVTEPVLESEKLNTELSEVAAPKAVPETTGERLERETFMKWRKQEAAKMDSTQVNEDLEITSLQAKLQKMTATEWKEVARQVVDTSAPANERVLSAYLMGQGGMQSELSLELAEDVLSKPLPNPGPHPVHSLDETEALKEKSLRLLIIDEMIEQVKKDRSRRAALDQLIRSIEDSNLRATAERRLREEGL